LGEPLQCHYLPGWPEGQDFAEALLHNRRRDETVGATQVGPHRAELKLQLPGQRVRHYVSRGQQKLVGAALVVAQSQVVARALNQRVVLLVDEPGAELDQRHLARLVQVFEKAPAQLFVTALEAESLPLTARRVFHVEHGKLVTLV
jgi:DNA replication and repair protein RecF